MAKGGKASKNRARYLSATQLAEHEILDGVPLERIERALSDPKRAHARSIAIKTRGQHKGRLVVQSEKELVRFAGWVSTLPDDVGTDEETESVPTAAPVPVAKTPTADTGAHRRSDIPANLRVAVPVDEFAAACEVAVANARGLALFRKSKNYENLMRYKVDVTAGGVTAPVRLDLACALMKRKSLPLDAYGDTIQGATLLTRPHPQWVISYDISRNLTPEASDAANIDHLIPRSAGGKSVLCNLHVMRKSNNSRKSSDVMPDVSGEPQESMRVLRLLSEGIHKAEAEGRLVYATSSSIEKVMRGEFAACIEMLSAKDVAILATGRVGHHVVKATGGIVRRAASSLASLATAPRAAIKRGVSATLVNSLMSA